MKHTTTINAPRKKSELRKVLDCWQLYVMLAPAFIYFLLFAYKPMYGVLIAFKNYKMKLGIMGSPWVGFDNFMRLFESYWFPVIVKNTLTISLMSLVLGFPLPIVFALMLNEVGKEGTRRVFQTISYAPHFITTVVLCGMITLFLSKSNGIINKFVEVLGGQRYAYMQDAGAFKWIYVITGMWQGLGWSSIIYFATLSGLDKSQLEAAEIDGASRFQKIIYINLPCLIPTMTILLIMNCGSILSVGYEKAFLLQTSPNLSGSEIISTYVYKMGLEKADFSFSTATNLLNQVCNIVTLLIANTISRMVSQTSLF